jgi:hypothetical protein
MTRSDNFGFPRIGLHRELKKSLEAHWKGTIDGAALHATAREVRARHWQLQRDAGIEVIPSNDFSFYDHMLDMTAALSEAPPDRLHRSLPRPLPGARYRHRRERGPLPSVVPYKAWAVPSDFWWALRCPDI